VEEVRRSSVNCTAPARTEPSPKTVSAAAPEAVEPIPRSVPLPGLSADTTRELAVRRWLGMLRLPATFTAPQRPLSHWPGVRVMDWPAPASRPRADETDRRVVAVTVGAERTAPSASSMPPPETIMRVPGLTRMAVSSADEMTRADAEPMPSASSVLPDPRTMSEKTSTRPPSPAPRRRLDLDPEDTVSPPSERISGAKKAPSTSMSEVTCVKPEPPGARVTLLPVPEMMLMASSAKSSDALRLPTSMCGVAKPPVLRGVIW